MTAGQARAGLASWALMAALAAGGCGQPAGQQGGAGEPQAVASAGDVAQEREESPDAEDADRLDAVLYFADDEGRLTAEAREMRREPSAPLQARALIEALVSGPRTDLTPVLPPESAVRAIHISPDGTAYVDFNAAFAGGLRGGSEDSLLALRSLVETLAANMDQVRRVKVLVEGEEPRELGGHLDLSRPLAPQDSVE